MLWIQRRCLESLLKGSLAFFVLIVLPSCSNEITVPDHYNRDKFPTLPPGFSELDRNTQETHTFSWENGSHENTTIGEAGLVRTSSGPGVWTSEPLDTKLSSETSNYAFWEDISFLPSALLGGTFQVRSSPDSTTWSEWSKPYYIYPSRPIDAPQDRFFQIRILLDETTDVPLEDVRLKYTKAFVFEMNPFFDEESVFDEDFPPANRRVIRQGSDFYFQNSDGSLERAKFYGIQIFGPTNFPPKDKAESVCKNLRKLGYNSIKTHIVSVSQFYEPNESIVQLYQDGTYWNSGSALILDPTAFDKLDFFLAKCAEEGLYTYLRLMNPPPLENDGLFDQDVRFRGRTNMLNFFLEDYAQFHRVFVEKLLTHRNPYRDNMRYADDPAIYAYELTNENSMLNGWSQDLLEGTDDQPIEWTAWPPITVNQEEALNQRWNAWLDEKYFGLDSMLESSWGGYASDGLVCEDVWPPPDEDLTGLRPSESLALYNVERMTRDCRYIYRGRNLQRFTDEREFYQSLDKAYFSSLTDFIKTDLNAKGLIVGTNFYGNIYDTYETHTSNDFSDLHIYWEGIKDPMTPMLKSIGPTDHNMIWRLASVSMSDRPMTLSEYNTSAFHLYQSDVLPTVAAYASFYDWDAMYNFSYHADSFQLEERFRPFAFATFFDSARTTMVPLLSRAYREWISPSKHPIERQFTERRLIEVSLNTCLSVLGIFMDGCPGNNPNSIFLANTYAFQHALHISDTDAATDIDVTSFLDEHGLVVDPSQIVESDTDEIRVNGRTGTISFQHPSFQGVSGSIGGGLFSLPAVHIQPSHSAYESSNVLLGSLDGEDLQNSRSILVTASSRQENYNLRWMPGHKQVVYDEDIHYVDRLGGRPVLVTGVEAAVWLETGQSDLRVFKLDSNGVKQEEIPSIYHEGQFVFAIRANDQTLWYLIEGP